MSANHVRVYDELPGAYPRAVVEPDVERAAEMREVYDVEVFDSVDALSEVREVSISDLNEHHRTVAEDCVATGLDILVEKPLSLTAANAEAIVEIAEANGVVLQVGHVERFNPAVRTLEEILEAEDLIAVDAHRLGPFNDHLTAEIVVFDLMIHDIDVITSIEPGDLGHTSAFGTHPVPRK